MSDYYLSGTNRLDDMTIATDGETVNGGTAVTTATETIDTTTNTAIATQITSNAGQTVLNGIKIYCKSTTSLAVTAAVHADDTGDPAAAAVTNASRASVTLVEGWNIVHFATAATISESTQYWIVVTPSAGTGTLGGGAKATATHTKYYASESWTDSAKVNYFAGSLLTDATGTAGEIAFTVDEFGHVEEGSDDTIRQAVNTLGNDAPTYVCDTYHKIECLGSAKAGVNAIVVTHSAEKNTLTANKNFVFSCDVKMASPSVTENKGFNITTADLQTDIVASYTASASDWTHIEAKLTGGADILGTSLFSFTEMDGTFYIANIQCRQVYDDKARGAHFVANLTPTETEDMINTEGIRGYTWEVDNTTGPTYSVSWMEAQ